MKKASTLVEKNNFIEEINNSKQILESHDIQAVVKDNKISFDATFANNTLNDIYELHVAVNQVERAKEILLKASKKSLQEFDPDHYLFNFSNEELYEVLLTKEDWSNHDVQLAEIILKERKVDLNDDLFQSLNELKSKKIPQTGKSRTSWLIAGYFFSIFSGFVGSVIATYMLTVKDTLPDGTAIYKFSKRDRKHAKWMITVGVLTFSYFMKLKYFN